MKNKIKYISAVMSLVAFSASLCFSQGVKLTKVAEPVPNNSAIFVGDRRTHPSFINRRLQSTAYFAILIDDEYVVTA